MPTSAFSRIFHPATIELASAFAGLLGVVQGGGAGSLVVTTSGTMASREEALAYLRDKVRRTDALNELREA